MLESFLSALAAVTTPEGLMLLALGTVVAFILGVLPGLSSTEGMIILLPFTFSIGLNDSMILLSSAYAAGFVGGAVTSIFLGIPGSSVSLATMMDGYPLHKQGRTSYAISLASVSSAVAGIFSLLLVALLLPYMEPISLLFGPVEWFAFVVFGLVILSFAGETTMLRGLFSAGLGLLAGTVGLSVMAGVPRYTMGVSDLWGGIPIIAAFVGLYPIAEAVFMAASHPRALGQVSEPAAGSEKSHGRQVIEGIQDTFRYGKALSISAVLGWLIGVVPGVGATFANFMAYLVVKGTSADKSKFGRGDPRGLIAAEASNNATVGGALIPALALGIPGSLNTAILLGVFMLNGVAPGSNIFTENLEVTWVILLATAFGTLLASGMALCIGARALAPLARIEQATIVPLIVFISCLAVLLARGNPFDLFLAFGLGLIGVLMKVFRLSRLSFVIALMLGPLVESSFFQALSVGRGSPAIFIQSAVANIIWLLVFGSVAAYIISWVRAKSSTTDALPERSSR